MIIDDKIKITMLPARAGDCLLIEFIKEDYRILIDGGYADTYDKYLRQKLVSLAEQGKKINLMVITHIDADHIGGILAFLKENGSANESTIIQVDEVWYNAFHHIYDGNIQSEATPYIIKEIFRGSIAATSRMYESNRQNISVSQGNTLAGLLKRGGYNWNTIYNKKAVCVENGISKELTSKIQCTLLGPDKEALNKLAELWINKMNGTVKRFIVCDDDLYSEAFECGQLQMINISDEIKRKDVAYESASQRILSWKELADNWQQKIDASPTNRSSIAFLLEYDGLKMLFPGDSPLQLFKDNLPQKMDIVKLPHHGSEKNIYKSFIQNTEVEYYLLSTEGKRHDHPSKSVIGSIFCKAKESEIPSLVKNYEICELDQIGIYERYEDGKDCY